MSCCGNKRQAWLSQSWPAREERSAVEILSETEPDNRKSFWFEWIGQGSFQAVGLATKTSYQWYFSGQKQEVAFDDSFALMAENGLRICSPD